MDVDDKQLQQEIDQILLSGDVLQSLPLFAVLFNSNKSDSSYDLKYLRSLIQAKDIILGYKVCETLLMRNPNNQEILFEKAKLFMAQNKLDESLQIFKSLVVKNLQSSQIYEKIADIQRKQGLLEEAAQNFSISINLNPKSHFSLTSYIQCLQSMGRTEQALPLIKNAYTQKANQEDSFFLNEYSYVLLALEKYDEAFPILQKSIELNPKNFFSQNNYGYVLVQLGKFKQGITALEQSIKLNKNYPNPHKHIGAALVAQGLYQPAIVFLQNSISLNPKYQQAYFSLGQCYYKLKNNETALDYLLQSLEIDQSLREASELIRKIFLENNPPKEIEQIPQVQAQPLPIDEAPLKKVIINQIKKLQSLREEIDCNENKIKKEEIKQENKQNENQDQEFSDNDIDDKFCELFEGNFQIDEILPQTHGANLLGTGGFASVYEIVLNQKQYAVKVFLGIGLEESEMVEKEFKFLKSYSGPRIASVFQLIKYHPQKNKSIVNFYIVMKLYKTSLSTILKSKKDISFSELVKIAIQLAEGVQFLHTQKPLALIHGDLKPDNVLIDQFYNAYISDFGISKTIANNTTLNYNPQQQTQSIGCTIPYAAPQQLGIQNQKSIISPETDIYSLGATLYQMFMREFPIFNKTKDVELPQIKNRTLRILLEQMLKFNPNKRSRIQEVLTVLKLMK